MINQRGWKLSSCDARSTCHQRPGTTALNLQKGNIYVANGLGAVVGSLGQLDAAHNIMKQLQDSIGLTSGFVEVPDVHHQHPFANY